MSIYIYIYIYIYTWEGVISDVKVGSRRVLQQRRDEVGTRYIYAYMYICMYLPIIYIYPYIYIYLQMYTYLGRCHCCRRKDLSCLSEATR